ncbi:sensor histidine kinase [Flavisolibacter ginsengisoli]|jgi:two-component system phosphate regulon sensor histidine kinase PhoR|uniref:histidine kinase n=1 Tax=Flavisolibacter ginsengisoli DSM 18119 TaxID=1121884 RepID=A0A1M5CCC4_9BACT|nr:HAMP domain-containing sensor histidine kinase [Flavisolibacter ginsengisoli]SHF52375.1 two-component system, OmpR family, phosphate regulon sensor histidine kinase PhoR [Flavisolibacter ginsengisoli DSM 18119]
MRKFSYSKGLPVLMVLTIMAIAAFQVYWLSKAYDRERRNLEMRTNFMFRETVFDLQGSKLKLDKLVTDSSPVTKVFIQKELQGKRRHGNHGADQKVINMVDILTRKVRDSTSKTILIRGSDTVRLSNKNLSGRRNRLVQFLFDVDSVQDSLRVKELQMAYARKLEEQNVSVPFIIRRVKTEETEKPVFNQVTLGFQNPITYELNLGSTTSFLLKRISIPILFSVFLVAFTFLSFSLLYGNLLRQRRLADIKNEFISNITHELKTPIATVSVAIEAMRSFNASMDPQRSKEYLDISANELQRLSLLVDKVLKLSMFEKKEIELRYELLDMKELVDEVTSSMRLQFEKKGAQVTTHAEGDTHLDGDRLHLVSVIFNLLDNALKYSTDHAEISLTIKGLSNKVQLIIADSGIGIPAEYQGRIFEKFFRVPTGNLHNAKGYGLGLSYVSHVITKHHGTIRVESEEGDGSKFYITLPKHQA